VKHFAPPHSTQKHCVTVVNLISDSSCVDLCCRLKAGVVVNGKWTALDTMRQTVSV